MGTLAVSNASSSNNLVVSMSGGLRLMLGTFTFSTSYTTGGEAFDIATSFPGLAKSVTAVLVQPAGGNTFAYDATNKKLIAYAGATQVAGAVNLSTLGALPYLAFVR